jgi:hypothetical protein
MTWFEFPLWADVVENGLRVPSQHHWFKMGGDDATSINKPSLSIRLLLASCSPPSFSTASARSGHIGNVMLNIFCR